MQAGMPPGLALEEWVGPATNPGRSPHPVREVHWLDQVHGATVVVVPDPDRNRSVTVPGDRSVGSVFAGTGDALVSDSRLVSVAVLTADCASVALGSAEGVFAEVHAGWKGLLGGVVERTVETMRSVGATEVSGALGPCIHAECYEFSDADLARVTAVYGEGVRGRTTSGRPALDIPAVVSAALAAAGVSERSGVDRCTACGGGYFSHRERGDRGRQALIVWSTASGDLG